MKYILCLFLMYAIAENAAAESPKNIVLTLADYRRANPDAETVSYTEVKNTLAETCKINTRSITNFFLGSLCDYETVGGNRNKAIVLPEE
ncbi:MAG: hypothetical protein ACPGLY_21390 [Rubripirellula sp.]